MGVGELSSEEDISLFLLLELFLVVIEKEEVFDLFTISSVPASTASPLI